MDKEFIRDIFEWDVVNWSRALGFWAEHSSAQKPPMQVLELGGHRGGLSLWAAKAGHQVICSDLHSPQSHAGVLHKKYGVDEQISYQAIDATSIPYENKFDRIVFKSILGGVGRQGNEAAIQKAIAEIHKALKPGGQLLYAENLSGSILHTTLRKRFVSWAAQWNYIDLSSVDRLFEEFDSHVYHTSGFFGAFGRTETQRTIVGHIDSVLNPILPKSWQYILMGVATKSQKERGHSDPKV